ncbi:MAG: hypothetical protein HY300_14495 [Verrucomicrobia bacterium]|nr:hypothetical protein [Verrucomicrobiota bacterium]
MSDNLNLPAGAAPPKPAEASKVQPKKETVRISLPPKAAAKETVRLDLPPKPAAKETVRLELPPRPAAATGASVPGTGGSMTAKPNVSQTGPTISLVVPQVDDASKTVKIPNPAEMVTLQHAPKPATPAAKPAAPGAKPAFPAAKGAAPAAKGAAPAEAPPEEAVTMAPGLSKGSVQLPAAGKEAARKEKAIAVPGKTSVFDIVLAYLAMGTAIGALVRLFLLL